MAQGTEENVGRRVWKIRVVALLILVLGAGFGYFVSSTEAPQHPFSFKLGLDLTGGTHLVYHADTSGVSSEGVNDAMAALRDVIERRVNLFGVAEPIVQVEQSSFVAESEEERLIVELPGVTDVNEAVQLIGKTPQLDFRLVNPNVEGGVTEDTPPAELFIDTGLTGRYIQRAQLSFGQTQGGAGLSNEPLVLVTFNDEGKELFSEITRDHVGEQLAIFLDGQAISVPTIQEEIPDGQAVITGNFTPESARELVRNLNFGALPVPINLISTQSVGASLGKEAIDRGVFSGLIGLGSVIVFLILWYRLPGFLAGISLALYIALMLTLFKLIPVTLTAAGIAGFILSIGMAVDANILIFERIKEEFRNGKSLHDAITDGFSRAWLSIRDSNTSSILTAVILFWLGTSIIEGFALVFGLGVLVSMLTAILVSRTFLHAVGSGAKSNGMKILFGSGIKL